MTEKIRLDEKYLNILKDLLLSVFSKEDKVKVFVFGSRATGKEKKFSDLDLLFYSRKIVLDKKLSLLEERIENSDIPIKVDIVDWKNLVKEYAPQIKKQKIPFWNTDEIEIKSPWRICPIGKHWVKRHPKDLKSGKQTDHDGHCRKNPSGKDVIKTDEIKILQNLEIFQKTNLKADGHDLGFGERGTKFDHIINGVVAYWNEMLKPSEPLHPNIVKTLIATESSFLVDPPVLNKKHKAIGIMQLLPETIKYLKPTGKQLRDHFVVISEHDAKDPVVNIFAGTRWLFKKRDLLIRRNKNATWLDVLSEYKGISAQKNPTANKIRENIQKYFNMLNKN